MTYRIEKYGADGCNGPEDAYVVSRVATIEAARAIVRSLLGIKSLRASRQWLPLEGGEAYHDFPPSHAMADGCGGYAIMVDGEIEK